MLNLMSAFVMTTLLAAAPALADCGGCGTKETTTATKEKTCSTTQTVADKSTCGDKATTVASKKTCGSDAQTVASKKTCATTAQTVADKGSCGSPATTVAGKQSCATPAQTVAGKDSCDSSGSGQIATGAPAMIFLVGDQKTECPCTAEQLAKQHDAKITYLVGDEKYCEKPAAMTAYAKALDKHLAGMTKVSFVVGDKETCCEKTAGTFAKADNQPVRYRVAMVDFSEARQAREAAQRAEQAASHVKMTYRVGDKSYACPMTAQAACASPGGDNSAKPAMHFVVNDDTTECSVTAKVMLLQAKINAAAEAATLAKTELEAPASAQAS